MTLPDYFRTNTFVRDGELLVTYPGDLTSQQRLVLNATTFGYKFAQAHGKKWDESNLPDAARFAGHILVPEYRSIKVGEGVMFMSAETIARNYVVPEDFAKYRKTDGRQFKGLVTTLSDDERRNLRKGLLRMTGV